MTISNITINNEKFPIDNGAYIDLCENLKKRVIRILYLKEDVIYNKIQEEDLMCYIHSLTWDLYGAYTVFGNCKFLNCICELEGIRENIYDDFARKKILDLANFVGKIYDKKG